MSIKLNKLRAMELDIRKMVAKAHNYADNYLADNLSKWYALRKAYADGYKEAYNDIQNSAEAKSSNENSGLNKPVVKALVCTGCGADMLGYAGDTLCCKCETTQRIQTKP